MDAERWRFDIDVKREGSLSGDDTAETVERGGRPPPQSCSRSAALTVAPSSCRQCLCIYRSSPRTRLGAHRHTHERERESESERERERERESIGRNPVSDMSWQPYVDEHLMCDLEGGQTLRAAAIVGHDGSVWAQSDTFPQFKTEEITAIMNDFAEPGCLAPTGLYLGDTKYMVIQGEAGAVIRGKKGSGGLTVKKTNQALIIGVYDEPVTPGQCNMVVEKLGDYLVDQGL